MKAMFISHAVFLFQKQYLLFKVHCQPKQKGSKAQPVEKVTYQSSMPEFRWHDQSEFREIMKFIYVRLLLICGNRQSIHYRSKEILLLNPRLF